LFTQLLAVPSHGRKSKLALKELFSRALIPFMGDLPSLSPKGSIPDTITLGVRISIDSFWRDTVRS
jgi:hypothetical protein